MAYASSFFDVAGIQAGKTAQLKNINKPEVNRSYAFIDLAYMSYGEISRLDWDEFYFFDSFDNPGSWFVQVSAGNAGVSLNFSGETEDPDAYPWMLRIYDYTGGAAALPITDGVYTGTIYAFAKNDIPGLSELEIAPIGGAGIVSMATYYPQQGCQVTLYFSGSGDTAVLTDAEITFFE